MNFAVPTALAWAALAAPIVIFYILKVRLRRVPVSTNMFWRQVFDEKKPRSIWQRLRHLLSLLAQILLLLLLVCALARPFFSWEALESQRLVLVVDNSASMQATDVQPTRLQTAKDLGLDAIARLRQRDEMAIVVAGTQPHVVCGLTGHQRTLRGAVRGILSTDGPTRVAEAVTLARRLIGDFPRGRVLVLSDGCFEHSLAVTEAEDVHLVRVGQRTGNVGITQFQVRRSLLDPVGYEILVEILNASDDPAECRLEIDLDPYPVDVVPLQLAAGEKWAQTFEKTSEEGGRLLARLDIEDALEADNEAIAFLPQRARQRVLLVTEGNLFLQKALEANSLVDLTIVPELPESYDSNTVVVFHRKTPQQLPAGSVLVVDPGNGTDDYELGDPLENPIVTQQDEESDLMRHVRLDNVVLPEARRLTVGGQHHILVEALSSDPLYWSLEQDDRKLLVLTVNLDKGDLTFRTAFPILMTNALRGFAGESGELRLSLSTGSLVEIELPQSELAVKPATFVLRTPSGEDGPLPSGVAMTTIGPLAERGVWSVLEGSVPTLPREDVPSTGATLARADESSVSEPFRQLACNLTNRAETDLRAVEELTAETHNVQLASGWLTRPIWLCLIVLAWLVACAEWFLYQRRWIG